MAIAPQWLLDRNCREQCGNGETRYLCTRPTTRHHKEVFVWWFSAGSYSGICLLHMLWKLPSIDARGKLGGIVCSPFKKRNGPPYNITTFICKRLFAPLFTPLVSITTPVELPLLILVLSSLLPTLLSVFVFFPGAKKQIQEQANARGPCRME